MMQYDGNDSNLNSIRSDILLAQLAKFCTLVVHKHSPSYYVQIFELCRYSYIKYPHFNCRPYKNMDFVLEKVKVHI